MKTKKKPPRKLPPQIGGVRVRPKPTLDYYDNRR